MFELTLNINLNFLFHLPPIYFSYVDVYISVTEESKSKSKSNHKIMFFLCIIRGRSHRPFRRKWAFFLPFITYILPNYIGQTFGVGFVPGVCKNFNDQIHLCIGFSMYFGGITEFKFLFAVTSLKSCLFKILSFFLSDIFYERPPNIRNSVFNVFIQY